MVALSEAKKSHEPSRLGIKKPLKSPPAVLQEWSGAKKLELNDLQTQEGHQVMDTANPPPSDTATVTPALELAEIVAAWPSLAKEIRTAILTLMRLAKSDADSERRR